MKKNKLAISLSLLFVSTTALASCEKKIKYDINYDNFYGVCALTGETGRADAVGLTGEWTEDRIRAMGFKSMRYWLGLSDLFQFDANGEIQVVQSEYEAQRSFVDHCKNAGIKSFLVQISGFITPYGVHYDNSYSTPDPDVEPDLYLEWLNCNGKACAKAKELFPEFDIFEPGNEPDFDNATCIHRDGFIWNGNYSTNVEYLYSDEVKTSIILDLCWYCRKYLKEVDPNAKVAIPGLTNLDPVVDFLDLMYQRIESKRLPFGQEYSDTDPDNYFDYLNWHPYSKVSPHHGPLDEEWVEFNKNLYQVAINHNDGGKPVLFSEFGWASLEDTGETLKNTEKNIGKLIREGVATIKKELPFVEAIYYFRLSCLYNAGDSDGSASTWGLFYNPTDPINKGAPREQAKEFAKVINGDDYVLEDHLTL